MFKEKLNRGKLLVAEPSIFIDSSFNRSVILLTEHNKEGSVGFIINKPSGYSINDLIPEINSNHTVYKGGPVSEDNLYFIHSIPHLIPNSVAIDDNIYWAGDFETVKKLLESNMINEDEIRFFLGYTGWSNNQLDEEIKEVSWIVKENSYTNILQVIPNSFWREELIKSGGEYCLWVNAPEDPNWN